MPTRHDARAALVILASCWACGTRPQPSGESAAPVPTDAERDRPVAKGPAATEPPEQTEPEPATTVLASAEGIVGPIVVELRGDQRTLLIDGVVQGQAETEPATIASRDPLDALMSSAGFSEGRVLLIGLGTGRTAQALSRNGRGLDVVELEPKVVDFAREYFQYQGPARVGDGAEFVASTTETYGLIVFDAFDGSKPPESLVSDATIANAKQRLVLGGGLVFRLLARADDPVIDELRRKLAPYHVRVFGSGQGSELQNLYLLASPRPIHMRRSTEHRLAQIHPRVGGVYDGVEVVGYLIREEHSGQLAIDLPHGEMGAQRYLLEGPEAAALEGVLPVDAKFPTIGDYGPGPGIEKAPRTLVGGEGVMRSDLRFSPVVVGVRGTAELVAEIDPDDAVLARRARMRAQAKGKAFRPSGRLALSDDPRLPHGGTLYKLQVESIGGTFTKRDWKRFRKAKLRAPLAKAKRTLSAGDLAGGHAALTAYLAAFDAHFGTLAPQLLAREGIFDVQRTLAAFASSPTPTPSPFEIAQACEEAMALCQWRLGDAGALRPALFKCAVDHYQVAHDASSDPSRPTRAAIHLVTLIVNEADEVDFDDPERARKLRKRANKLRKKTGARPKPR